MRKVECNAGGHANRALRLRSARADLPCLTIGAGQHTTTLLHLPEDPLLRPSASSLRAMHPCAMLCSSDAPRPHDRLQQHHCNATHQGPATTEAVARSSDMTSSKPTFLPASSASFQVRISCGQRHNRHTFRDLFDNTSTTNTNSTRIHQ